jgi:hypothetical protein
MQGEAFAPLAGKVVEAGRNGRNYALEPRHRQGTFSLAKPSPYQIVVDFDQR